MNTDALLERLRADEACDAAVLRIEDGDYGCEEPRDPPMVWLLLLLPDGNRLSREIPEPLLDALALTEGSLCRLADLQS